MQRSSPAVVAADPRWRQLADAKPDYNEPGLLAESEEAARVPEPASVALFGAGLAGLLFVRRRAGRQKG